MVALIAKHKHLMSKWTRRGGGNTHKQTRFFSPRRSCYGTHLWASLSLKRVFIFRRGRIYCRIPSYDVGGSAGDNAMPASQCHGAVCHSHQGHRLVVFEVTDTCHQYNHIWRLIQPFAFSSFLLPLLPFLLPSLPSFFSSSLLIPHSFSPFFLPSLPFPPSPLLSFPSFLSPFPSPLPPLPYFFSSFFSFSLSLFPFSSFSRVTIGEDVLDMPDMADMADMANPIALASKIAVSMPTKNFGTDFLSNVVA